MKRINLLILLLSIFILTISTESCKKDDNCPTGFSGTNCEIEDLCVIQNVNCQNGGACVDGTCDCPTGYIGTSCETFDPAQVQLLLDGGQTPLELVNGNVPLDSLYGKMYEGGFIFYLNTADGTGMVAATTNQSDGAEWGCYLYDVLGLNNVQTDPTDPEIEEGARIGDGMTNTTTILTECAEDNIAAKLCLALGPDWFLPSRGELKLMYTNLHVKGHGGFSDGTYRSSTEYGYYDAWFLDFYIGGIQSVTTKNWSMHVRAVRAF